MHRVNQRNFATSADAASGVNVLEEPGYFTEEAVARRAAARKANKAVAEATAKLSVSILHNDSEAEAQARAELQQAHQDLALAQV